MRCIVIPRGEVKNNVGCSLYPYRRHGGDGIHYALLGEEVTAYSFFPFLSRLSMTIGLCLFSYWPRRTSYSPSSSTY